MIFPPVSQLGRPWVIFIGLFGLKKGLYSCALAGYELVRKKEAPS
jgi:hypothetical protein